MFRKLKSLYDLRIPLKDVLTNPSILTMLAYIRTSKMPDPWYVQVEPSRQCNLRCPHCVPFENGGHMEMDTFKRIVDSNKNIKYVKLQGLGEPLLNPHLATMAEYAKSKGCITEIISNGTICPSHDLLDNIDLYVVSMETSNPEKYRRIRGISMDHIKNTLDFLHSEYSGRIGINCVMTGDTTEEDVDGVKVFAKQYGAVVTTPMMQNWLSPGHPGYEEMRMKVNMAMWTHFGKMGLKDLRYERFCTWSYTHAYYDYYGWLHPCCIRMSDCYILGRDWNGPIMRTFRKERRVHLLCKNCPL